MRGLTADRRVAATREDHNMGAKGKAHHISLEMCLKGRNNVDSVKGAERLYECKVLHTKHHTNTQ